MSANLRGSFITETYMDGSYVTETYLDGSFDDGMYWSDLSFYDGASPLQGDFIALETGDYLSLE